MSAQLWVEASGLVRQQDFEELSGLIPSSQYVKAWVGIGCSWKRLAEPSTAGSSTPALRELDMMLSEAHPRLSICVHYTPNEPGKLPEELAALVRHVPNLRKSAGLQINGETATASTYQWIRKQLPGVAIVCQVPIYRMSTIESQRRITFLGSIFRDQNLIDGILVDGSGGKGDTMHREKLHYLVREAVNAFRGGVLGVAGGLRTTDLSDLKLPLDGCIPLIDCTSGVSENGVFSVKRALEWYAASEKVEITCL